jgi:uncharacterized protein (TIGR02266 family)
MDITMDATGPDLSPLQVTFRTPEEFAAEYDQNLANGGLFIPTAVERPLRSQVSFVLVLGFSGQLLRGRGEVIYAVGAEQAAARGEQTGLGVQLLAFEPARAAEARREIQSSSNAAALEPPDHRRAVRFATRLQVRFKSRHQFERGVTRDISMGGMFLCTHEPYPAGSALQVVLVRPVDGKELVLEGEVARTPVVAGDDGLPIGMGIRFLPMDPARRGDVDRFVRFVDLRERVRTAPELRGQLRDAGIESVIHLLCHAVPEGELILRQGGESGRIAFKRANVVRAELPERGVSGEKAFYRMMTWEEGEFEFRPRAVEDDGWRRPGNQLVCRGIAARREVSGWSARIPSNRHIAAGPALRYGGSLPPGAQPLRALLAERPTVEAVLDRLAGPDVDGYRLLDNLRMQGMVQFE